MRVVSIWGHMVQIPMRHTIMLVVCTAALVVAGCTSLTPQQEAQIQANANRRVTCSKGADCDTKWGRAIAWISQNSRWKIQIQNESHDSNLHSCWRIHRQAAFS